MNREFKITMKYKYHVIMYCMEGTSFIVFVELSAN